MRAPDSPRQVSKRRKVRRDGWTPARQMLFLDLLAQTGSVTRAAAGVRLSRESAHRLRGRPGAELFAALWDRAIEKLGGTSASANSEGRFEGHMERLTDGELVRLLGRNFPGNAHFGGLPG